MSTTPTLAAEAWGKLRRDASGMEVARLPLALHCADVAAVTEALIGLPTVRHRLETLAGGALAATVVARLAVLAFLHDIGKAAVGFQAKALSGEAQQILMRTARIAGAGLGHTKVALALFRRDRRPGAADVLPLEEMAGWGESARDLWLAAISHHGEPVKMDAIANNDWTWTFNAWAPVHGYDPRTALRVLVHAVQREFPEAWSAGSTPLPSRSAFIHAFAGLVSLADWIASNDAEGFFPYKGHGGEERMAWARRRAALVVREMRLDLEDAREDLRARRPSFTDVFPDITAASGTQRRMEDLALGPVVILEDETGAGKTEAALWRFKALFESGHVDALAFVLPTRVAAVSLEGRINRFFRRLFPDGSLRPSVVLAVPGYLRVDGMDGERSALSRFETLWPDDPAHAQAHKRWAAESAKRYLAAAVAVGTVDQALLSGLKVRHAHLRGAALLRSLLVVDEVHASDPYMTMLLSNVLRRHVEAGGHALLLSATLGSQARDRLLGRDIERALALGVGAKATPEPVRDPEAAPYPAVSDKSGTCGASARGAPKTVEHRVEAAMDDPDRVAAIAVEAAKAGARVLVVRNTVGDAVAVQAAVEELLGAESLFLFKANGVAAPHHGRFAAEDRRVLDAAVEQAMGKSAPREHGLVLTGTQTLEQSLDIDADLLITDLCPADVLLQRIGRLHRHRGRERPEGFEDPRVIVLTPDERDLTPFLEGRRGVSRHGLGFVYESLLAVEATWRQLEARRRLIIPQDNRALVERTTHGDLLRRAADDLGGGWLEHWLEGYGKDAAQRTAALSDVLDWSTPWGDLVWPELSERVRTRLGLDDVLLDLPEPFSTAFGAEIRRIKMPGWMIPPNFSTSIETVCEIVEKVSDTLDFSCGGREYRYSRWGLARRDDQIQSS